jgi:hypothetical protein
VGQGDALVLSAGDGTAVVIDTGPEPALADRCLRTLGVRTIPLLLLTHFHADHVDGLPGVLRGRTVGAIETTTLDEPPDQAAFVRRQAAAAHVPLIRAAAGERRRLGPLDWQVLWPPATPGVLPDDGPNDASVTLLVRTAGLTVLLLGDLEPAAQQRLLATTPGLPRVDVLKVAHHGSAYQDPALLARLRPRLAVISCGADNPEAPDWYFKGATQNGNKPAPMRVGPVKRVAILTCGFLLFAEAFSFVAFLALVWEGLPCGRGPVGAPAVSRGTREARTNELEAEERQPTIVCEEASRMVRGCGR